MVEWGIYFLAFLCGGCGGCGGGGGGGGGGVVVVVVVVVRWGWGDMCVFLQIDRYFIDTEEPG